MAENIDFDELEKEDIYDNVEEAKHNPSAATSSEIKKPQSAFAIYIKENKDQIKVEMQAGNMKQTLLLSEASKRWNALSSEAKQKYHEMVHKQKELYH